MTSTIENTKPHVTAQRTKNNLYKLIAINKVKQYKLYSVQ